MGHVFSASRSFESRLHGLNYGYPALITLIFFHYRFLSFYCDWK